MFIKCCKKKQNKLKAAFVVIFIFKNVFLSNATNIK